MPRVFVRTTLLALLALSFLASGCVRDRIPSDRIPLNAIERATNVASFDEVWSRVDTTHYEPTRLSGGESDVDWAAVKKAIRPKAERAATMFQARAAIDEMVGHLGETHFALLPVEGVDLDPRTRPNGAVGITLRIIGGKAVVWRVERDSPASRAGVQPGWVLKSVNRADIEPMTRTGPQPTTRAVARAQRRAQDALATLPKKRITATFIDAIGHGHDIRLTAVPITDTTRLGDLPPMSLRIDSATLTGGVGYFSLSSFLDPPRVMPAFDAFLHKHANAPGIILDLRGNPGGISGMASGIAGYFIDREGASLGTMITRDDKLPFTINPRLPGYRGKVAILVDGQSESTSEILAAGLQDLGRARIFGQPTGGAALSSTVTTLSNGDRFQYAVADFARVNGKRIEGVGVMPDVLVPLTRSSLLANLDKPLEAASDWIRETTPATTPTTNDTRGSE